MFFPHVWKPLHRDRPLNDSALTLAVLDRFLDPEDVPLRSLPACLLAGLTLLTWKADKPEADVVVPEVGIVPAAVRRPAVPGVAAPRADPQDTVGPSGIIHPYSPIIRSIFIAVMVVILAPFPYVAVHIIQAEGIGLFFTHRM